MLLFHKRRLARVAACFFLLEIISSIIAPTVTWAFMGPSQPEFTSYEPAGSTDMVNLSTGDLSYSIPVLDIPGPERSFSLPLTYKAGIQLEQEASWVGLGWSLNPGAIARSVNGYPDDANGDPVKLTMHKSIARQQDDDYLFGLYTHSWNSVTGNTGSIDLLGLAGINWDDHGVQGGDLIGIGYQSSSGVGVDGLRLALAVVTIATLGSGSAASLGTRVGLNLNKQIAMHILAGAAFSSYGLGRQGGVAGYNNKPTKDVSEGGTSSTYTHIFQNSHATEHAYGSLYFGNMSRSTNPSIISAPPSDTDWPYSPNLRNSPTFNNAYTGTSYAAPRFTASRVSRSGFDGEEDYVDDVTYELFHPGGTWIEETASDIYQAPAANGSDYYTSSKNPISIAHDYFSVMGEGASGTIRPTRLDVGSVAYPKLGLDDYYFYNKYMVVPFLDADHDNYKVGFRYEGSASNAYDYHAYTPAAGQQEVGFDVNANNNALSITDPRLGAPAQRVQPQRKGLSPGAGGGASNRQLVNGKHIVWYSNSEIEEMASYTNMAFNGYANGFLNFKTPSKSTSGAMDAFRHDLPPNGIGAFAVTVEDGTTYHYSLPVYQRTTYSETTEQQTPSTINGSSLAISTRKEGAPGAANTTNPHGGYATTWLLTAITSPDYVDRNNSGTVDAADWGGWVRLDYGRYSSQFKWRVPYVGGGYTDDSMPIQFESFTEGMKETYYLNSISTRTHTALFIKSRRQDGRGHFTPGNTLNSELNINDQFPAASLRLDEIVLLDNATLAKLQTPDGIRNVTDSNLTPIPALRADNNASSTDCAPGDSWGQVLDAGDFAADASGRVRAYLEGNLIKCIRFNYSYDLCPKTPNSFVCRYGQVSSLPPMGSVAQAQLQRTGKLTLNSISFFGPTINQIPTKIIPDFTFKYDATGVSSTLTNPEYGKEKWDAFGMYQPAGQHDITSHRPAQSTAYAAPWTLTTIISPLGGTTEITYERDQYAHVSEYGTRKIDFHSDGSDVLHVTGLSAENVSDIIHPGDYVELSGLISCRCQTEVNGSIVTTVQKNKITNRRVKVIAVNDASNTVTLESDFGIGCASSDETIDGTPTGSLSAIIANNRVGGDIRVAAITSSNPESGEIYQVKYRYTDDNLNTNANSTGVLAKEPSFTGKIQHAFEQVFDYPTTPVLYSQVSVLRGLFRQNSNTDWQSREVYSFFTPTSSMIQEQQTSAPKYPGFNGPEIEFYNNKVEVHAALVGRPKAVRTYNQRGQLEISTEFEYSEQIPNPDNIPRQGHFTEGVMTNEMLANRWFNTNRTTKHYYPSVLVASHRQRNGITSSTYNNLFDFYTGQVVESSFQNARNETIHSRTVPAYTIYSSMGPKGIDGNNSHMLLQPAAQYVLKENINGPTYNPLQFLENAVVLSASVQTWKGDWANYRGATIAGEYTDLPGPYKAQWRQAASYQWQSLLLRPDGSFANFSDFGWQATPDAHWIKTSETTRYDHYSHALEARSLNGEYTAIRTGYGETQEIAGASNAKYTEVAYSGAEDAPVDINGFKHFGSEVVTTGEQSAVGPSAPEPHSGSYTVRLAATKKLCYRAVIGTDVLAGKQYRLSAWVHKSDVGALGRLYASINGNVMGDQRSISSTNTKKAGDWYRVELAVTIPAGFSGQAVEFGVANTSGAGSLSPAIYVDDFRVCPMASAMVSRVYDARTNRLTYLLDNENLYIRYQYYPDGRLYRTYRESFDRPGSTGPAGKLVKEYVYNYARTPSATISVVASGAPTGAEILPASSIAVIPGNSTSFDIKSNDCAYVPTGFEVDGDGTNHTSSYVLPDGTQISFNNGHLSATNVRGTHAITISYQQVQFPMEGTILPGGYCEMDYRPCPTGQYIELVADGCGGAYEHSRQATAGECVPTDDCRYNIVNPSYSPNGKPLGKPVRKAKSSLQSKASQ